MGTPEVVCARPASRESLPLQGPEQGLKTLLNSGGKKTLCILGQSTKTESLYTPVLVHLATLPPASLAFCK